MCPQIVQILHGQTARLLHGQTAGFLHGQTAGHLPYIRLTMLKSGEYNEIMRSTSYSHYLIQSRSLIACELRDALVRLLLRSSAISRRLNSDGGLNPHRVKSDT